MVVRVPRACIATLRALIEEHLRDEYTWPGGACFDDTELDEADFVEFLYAALDYSRDAHPWTDQGGATVEDARVARDPASTDLFKALLYLEPRTPEAVIAALVATVPLEIVDASSGLRAAVPRLYRHSPYPWPDALGHSVENHGYAFWSENVFGIVERAGWLLDRGKRDRVFAAVDDTYDQLSFVEIDREKATRLACFLLAGGGRPSRSMTCRRRRSFHSSDQARGSSRVATSTTQSSGIRSRTASRSTWGVRTCVLEQPCSPC